MFVNVLTDLVLLDTKIYFCKKQTLKAVAERYHTAPVLFCGQIF